MTTTVSQHRPAGRVGHPPGPAGFEHWLVVMSQTPATWHASEAEQVIVEQHA